MRIKFFLKSLFIVGLLAAFIFSLTGCNKYELDESKLSDQGVALENYIPKDAMIMMTLNNKNELQKQKLDKLGSYFPQESVKKMYEGILEEAQMELDKTGINFEEDVKPIFGENYRVLMAMGGNPENLREDEMPEMYIAATVQDTEKMQALINKLAEGEAEKGEQFGATTLDNETEDSYLALYKDTILLTNKQNIRHSALKRMNNNEESILSNELYKEAIKGLPQQNFADFYINYENYFELINQLQEEDYPLKLNQDLKMAIAMGLYAEDEGVRMLSNAVNKGKINFRDFTFHEPYLFRGIPGENLIMYTEVYDIKKIIEKSLEVYEWDEETSKEMRKAELLIKKTIGLDLKEDVLTWMDKGFAMVVQRNQSMIPAISFYVDASSNPEGAQEVLDLMDTAMQQAYDAMVANAGPEVDIAKIVKKEVVEVGSSEMNRFSLDFSNLTEQELLAAGLPSGIFTEPVELYYGLTNNDYFVVSTLTGLDKVFEEDEFVSVGSNMHVESGREFIKDYPYNLSYISVDEAFEYVDQILDDMEKVEGPMDEEGRKAYEMVRDFFEPIKYMIAGDQKMQSAAFLKMQKPEPKTDVEPEEEPAPDDAAE
jgi:hypothetical protein